MGQVATMSVKFAADIAGFEKNVTKAEKTFLASAKSMTKMGEELSLKLTAPFLAITGVMAKSAADAEASMARFTRIFGPATDTVDAFAKQMMRVMPMTRSEMEQLLGTTQAFISQLGLAPAATIKMTETLVKLAGDIAAFRHIDISDVMQTLERGMAGRTQGLVGLGIAINKVAVEQEAYKLGLTQVGEKMTVAAQSQATMALVMEKTKNIQGEAAKTAGDSANALKFLHQATTELAEEWGKTLLPLATNIVHGLTDLARAATNADESTKIFAFSVAGAAAAMGPLLLVSGALIRSLTDIARLGRLAAGAEGLAALAVGGGIVVAVVAGLAAVGYQFWKSGEDARNAKAKVDAYKESLAGLSAEQLITKVSTAYSTLDLARANLNAAKVAGPGRKLIGPAGPGGMPTYSIDNSNITKAQTAYDTALAEAKAASDAYNGIAQMTNTPATQAAASSGAASAAKKTFDSFIAQAGTLLTLQPQLEQGWSGIDRIGNMQLSMYDRLTAALAAQTDQYGDQAIKLRDLIAQYQALHAVQLVTGTTMMTPASLMQVTAGGSTNTNSLGYTLMDASLRGVPDQGKLPSVPTHIPGVETKLDMLGGVFKDAIASQAQFIAQSLTTVLGVRNANAGGAMGATVAGAVGGAIAKEALGSAGGAIIGSVVPVIGTVLGSLAGGAIGNAIGKLFGGGGAANTASSSLSTLAAAAQKVTETLSNVPTGFKIALERYRVSDPSPIPFGASIGPSAGGVHFNAPVTIVTAAKSVADMYNDITNYARGQSVRGGTTQWQLAANPAMP